MCSSVLVYFEGSSVKDVLKITSYNKFQSLLLNLYYNKTPVILDIEDESNIDTSLEHCRRAKLELEKLV